MHATVCATVRLQRYFMQRRTYALIGKTPYVRIGVQAVASWASLPCVYIVFDGFQDFSIFYARE